MSALAKEAASHYPDVKARRPRADRSDPFPKIFAGRRRAGFLRLVSVGVAQGVALAAMAVLMRRGLDRAFPGTSASDASAAGGGVFILLACAGLAVGALKWLAHVEAERIGQSYAHALRMRLFRQMIEARAVPRRHGAVLLRLTGDLTPLRQWVSRGVAQLIVGGLTIVLALAALVAIDWRIGAAVAVTLSAVAIASLSLSARLGEATGESRRRRGRMANAAGETLSANASGERLNSRTERRRLRKLSRGVRDSLQDRAVFTGAIRAIAESGSAIAGVAAVIVGAVLSVRGEISSGAVMSAVFVAGVLGPQVNATSRCLEYWVAAQVARRKQLELIERLSAGEDED